MVATRRFGTPSASKRRKRRKPQAARAAQQNARREAILAAALAEFSARGFAATRLDDVARRAGIAKGTIYLYFRDKERLFQELVRTMISPIIGVSQRSRQRIFRFALSPKSFSTSSFARSTAPAAKT